MRVHLFPVDLDLLSVSESMIAGTWDHRPVKVPLHSFSHESNLGHEQQQRGLAGAVRRVDLS